MRLHSQGLLHSSSGKISHLRNFQKWLVGQFLNNDTDFFKKVVSLYLVIRPFPERRERSVGYLAPGLSPAYDRSLLEQDQMLEAVGKSLHITHVHHRYNSGEDTSVIARPFQEPLYCLTEDPRPTPRCHKKREDR